jgi:predicted ATP-grasp superfamily ATP-dependent carboligase
MKFKKAIVAHLRKTSIGVLMPVGMDTFTLVSKFKEELEKYTVVPVVSYDKFVQAHDKQKVLEIASKLKIPTPRTYTAESVTDSLIRSHDLSFPIVIKARKGSATGQVRYAYSNSDLLKILKNFSHLANQEGSFNEIIDYSRPIIQEFLPGDIYDVLVLYSRGELRAIAAQKRVLCYPVKGGSGALNITVDYPEIIKHAKKLMSYLQWHGVAMLEFKMNSNNIPCLIEVNPKFWGTLGLSISAGINFPYLLYKVALNESVPFQLRYANNKLHGWPFPMGVQHLLDSPTKMKSLGYYLKLWAQNDSTDIKRWDLTPLSWQLLLSLRIIAKKIVGSILH